MSEQTKVCPGCGYDPAYKIEGNEPEDNYCRLCGDKLVLRSELPRDIWKDPLVKEALKEGRQPWDIALLRCSQCLQLGYYNEGSHFSCRFCDVTFSVTDEDEVVRLDDTLTECEDGYHNRTL